MTLWASWREERVGGMPSRETPLSARQGEDTNLSSRPGWISAKLEEMPCAIQTEVRVLVPAVGLKGIASDASGGQDHNIFVD